MRTASLEPPFDATAPHCPHFGTCGGCSLQGVSYDTQLTYKVGATAQLLARVGGLDAAAVATSAAAPVAAPAGERLAYRSKMQLTFGSRVWQQHGSSAGCTPSTSTSSSTSSTVQVQERVLPPAQAAGLSAAAAPHSGWTPPPGGQVVQGWALGYLLPGSSDVVMPLQECALVVRTQRTQRTSAPPCAGKRAGALQWGRCALLPCMHASPQAVPRTLCIASHCNTTSALASLPTHGSVI